MIMISVLVALGVGTGLSLLYFGGLWLTVQRVVEADSPRVLLLGSFVVRTSLVLLGFYALILFMGDRWELLAVGLLGFVGGRMILVHRWRPRTPPVSPS